ncbi:hypothetical protein FB451DRAFT_350182 [Mycena latifolia]|nr:hypothetical protein FB451DRAFT_350182 [Mycena latifolia]
MDTRSTVHNFAFPGATAEDDLNDQLTRFLDLFKRPDAKSPPPLDPEKSTYLLWLGINDCGRTAVDDLEPIVESIIDAVHVLYTRASARNFVIFQVPPINRSPSVTDSAEEVDQRITIWNDLLRAQVLEFANNTKNANVSLFSAHEVLSEILDDPSQFDFSVNDPTDEGGAIWKDDLHLAPAVHAILAKRLLLELFSLKIE